jgi:hypothetical protein
MPLDLTDEELQTAAMACRSYAYLESERAKAVDNTDMSHLIQGSAERFAKLAEKLEAARRLHTADSIRGKHDDHHYP